MDIGIPIPNVTPPATPVAIRRIATTADELGFHSVWLGDHIVRPVGPDVLDYFKNNDRYMWDLYEPMVTAGLVAGITEHVKIGFGVIVLPYRNPIITAKAIASLDRLSDGRVILGVGVGYWPGEFRALNVRRRDTGRRTDEYIDLLRVLWSSDRPEFEGDFIEVKDVLFRPLPVQKNLPIWIGGMSDAAIRRAVRKGDGWHVPRFTVAAMAYQMERLREIAAAEGRDHGELTVSNRPEVRFALEPVEPEAAQTFSDQDPAPRAEPIIGPPGYVAERLAPFAELGVSHLVIDLHEGGTVEEIIGAMHTFANSVMGELPR